MIQRFLSLYSHLSLRNAQHVGFILGKLAYRLNGTERKVAEANVQACLPELGPEERDMLIRKSLVESGKLIAELPLAWLRSIDYWNDKVDENGLSERIAALQKSGRGILFVAPHLGNWEIGLNAITSSIQTTVLYRPPRQAWLEDIMTAGRRATGAKTAPTDATGIRLLLAALKKGEAVAVLPDQTPKANSSAAAVFAPFFGRPAYTMTLVSKLAARTGAAVITIYGERLDRGRGFRMHFADVDEAIYDKDIDRSVRTLNAAVEQCVLQCPEQYQWSYKRFTVAPEGVESLY